MKTKVIFRKDIPQTKALVKAGKTAAKTAIRASNALGLTMTYIENGVIYEEKEGIVVVKKAMGKKSEVPFKVQKGLVLHAK